MSLKYVKDCIMPPLKTLEHNEVLGLEHCKLPQLRWTFGVLGKLGLFIRMQILVTCYNIHRAQLFLNQVPPYLQI